jgi:Mg2+ and Co2+ transporter CorA
MASPASTPGEVERLSDSTVVETNTGTEKAGTQVHEVQITTQSEGPESVEDKPNAAHTAKQLRRLNELHRRQIDLYNYILNLDKSIHLLGRSPVTIHEEKLRLLGYVTDFNGTRENQYSAHLESLLRNHKARLAIFMEGEMVI